MLVIKSNKREHLIMNHTDTGIYYLHEYYPVRKFRYISDEKEELSRRIWAYKEQTDEKAFSDFTEELMCAIRALTYHSKYEKIGLMAVPPSKVGKHSSIRDSIKLIYQWGSAGTAKSVYGCNKVIYDYSELLQRVSDISTAHKGKGATYDEQRESINCIRDRLSRYRTAFVILDDVTTTGTSMNVCRDRKSVV